MKVLKLETVEQFESLKPNDLLLCEFHRDSYKGSKRTRLASYNILQVKTDLKEVILQMRNNVYFNYEMYLEGMSNLKDVLLIVHED